LLLLQGIILPPLVAGRFLAYAGCRNA